MKRFLAVFASLMLVLGFAASAFAIHAEIPSDTQAVVAKGTTQITLGGELRFRGWYTDNVGTLTGNGTINYWDDMDNDGIIDTGAEASTVSTVGIPKSLWLPTDKSVSSSKEINVDVNDETIHDDKGASAVSDSKSDAWYDARVRLSIQADVSKNTTGFVQVETSTESKGVLGRTSDTYTWDSMNQKPGAGFTILQAWIQHKGSGLLGVPASIKVGHMPVALGQKQFLDHTKFGDDAIALSVEPAKGLVIDLVAAKWAEGETAIAGDDTDAYHLIASYAIDKDNKVGIDYTWAKRTDTAIGNEGLSFQNLGLNAAGKIAGLSYAAEVDFQFGKTDKGTSSEKKFRGWGVFANLGYKLDPVNIRAGFAMGSGDKNLDDNKIKEFQTTMGRDIHYSFIYEYTLSTSAFNQVIDPRTRNTSIANTTYYRLGLDYSPIKDLSMSLDGFIIRATKTPAGVSKSVGSEIDFKASYKIDRNLTYSVIAGVFKPGKFYEDKYLDLLDLDKKTVTQVMHALTLSF